MHQSVSFPMVMLSLLFFLFFTECQAYESLISWKVSKISPGKHDDHNGINLFERFLNSQHDGFRPFNILNFVNNFVSLFGYFVWTKVIIPLVQSLGRVDPSNLRVLPSNLRVFTSICLVVLPFPGVDSFVILSMTVLLHLAIWSLVANLSRCLVTSLSQFSLTEFQTNQFYRYNMF